MAKLTKGDVTVETELPTEIAELKAGGFRTAEDQQRIDAAAKAAQKPANTNTGTSTNKIADEAADGAGKPTTGKPGK